MKSPKLTVLQQSLERIKMVSFPAGGENEAGSWKRWGEKPGGVVRGDFPCPSFVSLDLSSFSRCPHLIVSPERPWIIFPLGTLAWSLLCWVDVSFSFIYQYVSLQRIKAPGTKGAWGSSLPYSDLLRKMCIKHHPLQKAAIPLQPGRKAQSCPGSVL